MSIVSLHTLFFHILLYCVMLNCFKLKQNPDLSKCRKCIKKETLNKKTLHNRAAQYICMWYLMRILSVQPVLSSAVIFIMCVILHGAAFTTQSCCSLTSCTKPCSLSTWICSVRIYRFSPPSFHSTICLIMLICQNCLIILEKKVNGYVVCGPFEWSHLFLWLSGKALR